LVGSPSFVFSVEAGKDEVDPAAVAIHFCLYSCPIALISGRSMESKHGVPGLSLGGHLVISDIAIPSAPQLHLFAFGGLIADLLFGRELYLQGFEVAVNNLLNDLVLMLFLSF
jgi:hypothetical protein